MRQDLDSRGSQKQQERHTIQLLYKIEHTLFYILLSIIGLLCLIVLIGLIFFWEPWSTTLLNQTLPWPSFLAIAIIIGFLFPIADTFIQSKEDNWFARYGSEVQASVVGYEETHISRWRFLRFGIEQLAVLEWQHRETERTYQFKLRVRDQKHPALHNRVPVVIDYDDPTYYLKSDIKDPSIMF